MITIDNRLFPMPESSYSEPLLKLAPHMPLSILALSLDINAAPGNLLKENRKNGFFMFRDYNIPKPRPATILAWESLCRLGNVNSKVFLLPFLPSIRLDDEIGTAITERQIHIPSLSRKSKFHIREDIALADGTKFSSIVWGIVYGGEINDSPRTDNALIFQLDRSNVNESEVMPFGYHAMLSPSSLQDSIRDRMEFIAQYGIPASALTLNSFMIAPVNRLLFQFTNQKDAANWAVDYIESYRAIRKDIGLISADFKEMLHEMIEIRSAIQNLESKKPETKKKASFGNIDDIIF